MDTKKACVHERAYPRICKLVYWTYQNFCTNTDCLRKKIIKPISLLPDANVIIKAYQLNVWENLLSRISITVPSIIAYDEALFYSKGLDKIPDPINLRLLSESNRLKIIGATSDEIQSVLSRFDRVVCEQLHDGEIEALALLYCRPDFNHHICTSDSTAIKALALLDLSQWAISFEECLTTHGLKKPLDKQFTKSFLKENLKMGQTMRIMERGISKKK